VLQERDCVDASTFTAFVKSQDKKAGASYIIRFELLHNFPEVASTVSIRCRRVNYKSVADEEWVLDSSRYRFSPRWDSGRMAKEFAWHVASMIEEHGAARKS
jgi:hypothetical protein